MEVNNNNDNISSRHFPCGVSRDTLSSGTRCIHFTPEDSCSKRDRWRTAHRRSPSINTLNSHVWVSSRCCPSPYEQSVFIVHKFFENLIGTRPLRGFEPVTFRNPSQPFAHRATDALGHRWNVKTEDNDYVTFVITFFPFIQYWLILGTFIRRQVLLFTYQPYVGGLWPITQLHQFP